MHDEQSNCPDRTPVSCLFVCYHTDGIESGNFSHLDCCHFLDLVHQNQDNHLSDQLDQGLWLKYSMSVLCNVFDLKSRFRVVKVHVRTKISK